MAKDRIRDPEYAKRLTQACDDNPEVPDMHHGRLSWIMRALKDRSDVGVSLETISRWFAGQATPRPEKSRALADLLKVDAAWLQVGIDQNLAPKDLRTRSTRATAIATVVAGFIELSGHAHVSFPAEDDKFAIDHSVDFYAIIAGRNHFVHVTPGKTEGKEYVFAIPNTFKSLVVLGAVPDGFRVDIVDLKSELIERTGVRQGGSIIMKMSKLEFETAMIDDFTSPIE